MKVNITVDPYMFSLLDSACKRLLWLC